MLFLIGTVVVIGSVIGGYMMHHGNLAILWQPNEFVIIVGAAFGAFLITNPGKVCKGVAKNFKRLLKGAPYKKADYIDLLTMLYTIFKMLKSKGMLEIESHIENPHESSIFSQYPKFMKNHHAEHFLCDYLRIMTMGVEDFYQLEELMDRDLDIAHHEDAMIGDALINIGDAMPALGIVAAVLGVITTMGSISEPPEVLGGLIGAALVGTFLGVLLSYGLLAPMGRNIGNSLAEEGKYVEIIKVALLAHVRGTAPIVSIEFARNALPAAVKPTFQELEAAINAIPAAGG